MKNIIECKKIALDEIIDLSICDNIWVVIIKNNPNTINHWNNLGYNVTYDMVYFTNENEFNNFINGHVAYDYIDNAMALHNDIIACVLHNGKIIVM